MAPGPDRTPDAGTGPERPSGDPEDPRRLRPTSPAALTATGVVALVVGWLLRPVLEAASGSAPQMSWAQPATLLVVAAAVAWTAWATWRALQVRHERMEAHRAVNRLALGRATAYAGALVGGLYAGYAVSWLGLRAELAEARAIRSAVAALAGVVILVAGLVLERACRVRGDDPPP
ncbi:DUF3180 domain-containing protein [Nocardioides sp. Leaf285]|uniref:DUF3180 domain-containing protein n=1 Tax=Nocardioides sp. Leaf285 TaxID=1736322 RepID=UPI0009ECA9FA|nr:DUF3180 domain-containing protein [Nocardioides sp. Leaf285]